VPGSSRDRGREAAGLRYRPTGRSFWQNAPRRGASTGGEWTTGRQRRRGNHGKLTWRGRNDVVCLHGSLPECGSLTRANQWHRGAGGGAFHSIKNRTSRPSFDHPVRRGPHGRTLEYHAKRRGCWRDFPSKFKASSGARGKVCRVSPLISVGVGAVCLEISVMLAPSSSLQGHPTRHKR